MTLLLFVLASVGLTFITNFASILDPVKARLPAKVVDVLNCPQCVGFHVGLVLGVVLDPCPSVACLPLRLVAYGLASSCAAVLSSRLLN